MTARIAGRAIAARMAGRAGELVASNVDILRQIKAVQRDVFPRNEHPADWFRIENASAEEASVYIYDEIGYWGTSAAGFVDELNSITAPRLNIHINSPGGEVFDGVAIHSALMASKAHITVHIDGLAASAASFIAMAGDRIIMARHATMMIHDASGLCWGNPADMLAMHGLLDKLSNNIADMYALQADGTVEQWRERMTAETWYTGQEALAAGLVDEITAVEQPEETPADRAPTRLSLAAFNFSGRSEAPAPIIVELPEPEEEEKEPEKKPAITTDHERGMRLLAALMKG